MALGLKCIETRSWRPRYTGPLAIQAAQGFDQEYRRLCEVEPFRSALLTDPTLDPSKPLAPQLPRGSVLAFARLDYSEQVLPDIHLPGEPERTFGNYAVGRYMLRFSHLHRLAEPFEAVGGLNLWPLVVPDHLRCVLSELGDASSLLAVKRYPNMFVDDLVISPGGRQGVCRLATTDLTDTGVAYLHHMADRLALKREWFAEEDTLPHYRLQGARKRSLAVLHGAEPVSPAELERQCGSALSRMSATSHTALSPACIRGISRITK